MINDCFQTWDERNAGARMWTGFSPRPSCVLEGLGFRTRDFEAPFGSTARAPGVRPDPPFRCGFRDVGSGFGVLGWIFLAARTS